VVYADLGGPANICWIALDEFDPTNRAMVCGPAGVWSTTTLADAAPVWNLEIATPAGWDGFTMVRSSPVQDGVWMAVAWDDNVNVGVWWTINDGENWNNRQDLRFQNAYRPCSWTAIYLEMSGQDVNTAWVTWCSPGGVVRCDKTTDMWATYTGPFNRAAWLAHGATVPTISPIHHRHEGNADDLIAIWGGGYVVPATRQTNVVSLSGDVDGAAGTLRTLCSGVGAQGVYQVREVGCNKYANNRWWAFIMCTDDYQFRTSWATGGDSWYLQYVWTRAMIPTQQLRHCCDYRDNENIFLATEDGDGATTGPMWASLDRGDEWQRQTGNWAALCTAEGWTGGSEPDVWCVAAEFDV